MTARAMVEIRTASGAVLARRCTVAGTPRQRLRGLLGRLSLPAGEGLLLPRTPSVHTCGMRFAIDVVFLDGDDIVVRVVEALSPWRFAGGRGARAALELPAGVAGAAGVGAGEHLTLTSVGAPDGPAQTRPAADVPQGAPRDPARSRPGPGADFPQTRVAPWRS